MAKLECVKCGFQRDVPIVCCGPGVPNKTNPKKLDCPVGGPSHKTVGIPRHCILFRMKYVE